MSVKLYHGINHLTAGRRVETVAEMCGVEVENIRIPGADWKQPEHLKRNPFGKIPGMETPEGNLFESCTLMRYVARKAGKMYGSTPFETAQIDQWLEFFNTQLMAVFPVIYKTTFGYYVYAKEKFDDAIKELHDLIKVLDAGLKDSKFLGSKEINIADVAIALALRPIMRLYINEKTRNANPNFTKWFQEVNSNEVITKLFGKAWLCQKEFVPDFTFGKEAPKKEVKK
jgi:glutathione S-transferase